ncbi:lysoplasmalogenase [Verrucosispora sp. SN26_14.1]|uniref:lysoplasmalogenase n=1 Tax=Verrucosispora sp. SN26_14.1 TaxID=2527879 RepID=UPI00103351F2|nr:lysoplasmalogenase [Verrucosispora sp. SN26_14.1]TBL27758.1 lysoplasmalogenase [Verrucosispora sp. SN26_14.1]
MSGPTHTTDPTRRPDRSARTRRGTPWLGAFLVVAVVELIAVAVDATPVQWLAKPLLAPLLLAWLWRVRGQTGLVAVALVFATAGDIALLVPGEVAFLVGMGCFLGTQLALITAFVRLRRPPVPALVGYLLLWAGAMALLWPRLGDLRWPVLGYGLALTLMAATATAVNRRVAVGAALFLVSDLLIGLGAAGTTLPAHGVLVMTTYSAALLLITTGLAARDEPGQTGGISPPR